MAQAPTPAGAPSPWSTAEGPRAPQGKARVRGGAGALGGVRTGQAILPSLALGLGWKDPQGLRAGLGCPWRGQCGQSPARTAGDTQGEQDAGL